MFLSGRRGIKQCGALLGVAETVTMQLLRIKTKEIRERIPFVLLYFFSALTYPRQGYDFSSPRRIFRLSHALFCRRPRSLSHGLHQGGQKSL